MRIHLLVYCTFHFEVPLGPRNLRENKNRSTMKTGVPTPLVSCWVPSLALISLVVPKSRVLPNTALVSLPASLQFTRAFGSREAINKLSGLNTELIFTREIP